MVMPRRVALFVCGRVPCKSCARLFCVLWWLFCLCVIYLKYDAMIPFKCAKVISEFPGKVSHSHLKIFFDHVTGLLEDETVTKLHIREC